MTIYIRRALQRTETDSRSIDCESTGPRSDDSQSSAARRETAVSSARGRSPLWTDWLACSRFMGEGDWAREVGWLRRWGIGQGPQRRIAERGSASEAGLWAHIAFSHVRNIEGHIGRQPAFTFRCQRISNSLSSPGYGRRQSMDYAVSAGRKSLEMTNNTLWAP
jgi:hypothetical protein